MVDKISNRIMYELFQDGCASNLAIAHKLGISLPTATKKINDLIEKRIISVRAIPNPVKLGVNAGAFIGLNINVRKINNIAKMLMRVPNVNIMTITFGKFDMIIVVFFHNWRMLSDFINHDLRDMDGICSLNTHFISEIYTNKVVKLGAEENTKTSLKLNNKDAQIILELMNNGRTQYSHLAAKINASPSTVSRRVSALMRNEIISEIVAIPDNLEYLANAFLVLDVKYLEIDNICKRIWSFPETNWIMKITNNNNYNLIIAVHLPTRRKLYTFLQNQIYNIKGVLRSETFIMASYLYFNPYAMIYPPMMNITEENLLQLANLKPQDDHHLYFSEDSSA